MHTSKQQEQIRQHNTREDPLHHFLGFDSRYRNGHLWRRTVRRLGHSGDQQLAESFRHHLRGLLSRLHVFVPDYPTTVEIHPQGRAKAACLLRMLRALHGGPISVRHSRDFRRKPKITLQRARWQRHDFSVHGCP